MTPYTFARIPALQGASLVIYLVLVWMLPARAWGGDLTPMSGGLILGPVVAHVGLDTRAAYDSNVFRSETTVVADLVSSLKPILEFEMLKERSTLVLSSYFQDLRYYGLENVASKKQSDQAWQASSLYEQQMFSGTTFGLHGEYVRTSIPLLADLTLSTDRIRRTTGSGGIVLGQQSGSGTLDLTLGYDYTQDVYAAGYSFFDRQQHTTMLGGEIRLFSTLAVLAEARYLRQHRPTVAGLALSRQQDTARLRAGIKGSPNPIYTVEVYVGAIYRHSSIQGGSVRPNVAVSFLYEPSELLDLRLLYQYDSIEGVVSDELSNNKGLVSADRRLGESWSIGIKAEAWNSRFLPKAQVDRSDIGWRTTGRVEFEPEYSEFLQLGSEYAYSGRQSSTARSDFQGHVVTIFLALRY